MLTINPVGTGDSGNYDCVITSSCGATLTTNAAALAVTQSVAITTQPVSQTVTEGTTVIFTTAATGDAPVSYQWKRNNNVVPGGNSQSLLLLNVTVPQAGNYTCDVTNSCGTVITDTAVLTVEAVNTCPCDWNTDGSLTSQDFFDFISGFFTDNGDFNSDGFTTSQDFFDFISCFFTGC